MKIIGSNPRIVNLCYAPALSFLYFFHQITNKILFFSFTMISFVILNQLKRILQKRADFHVPL